MNIAPPPNYRSSDTPARLAVRGWNNLHQACGWKVLTITCWQLAAARHVIIKPEQAMRIERILISASWHSGNKPTTDLQRTCASGCVDAMHYGETLIPSGLFSLPSNLLRFGNLKNESNYHWNKTLSSMVLPQNDVIFKSLCKRYNQVEFDISVWN